MNLINFFNHELTAKVTETLRFLNSNYIIRGEPIQDLPGISNTHNFTMISNLLLDESVIGLKGIRNELNSKRYKYHLISIIPSTPSGASFAVRDNRSDIIIVNPGLGLKVFNKSFANRVIQHDKLVGIDCGMFFGSKLAKDYRPLYRILKSFHTLQISYVLINHPDNPSQLRSYRGLQAIGRLMEIPNKRSDHKYLLSRVKRNQMKISGQIPFTGVEIDGS